METGAFRASGFFLLALLGLASAISTGNAGQINNFNLTTSQTIRYAIGGARVIFHDIPLDNEDVTLKCIVHSRDGSIEIGAAVTHDRKQVTCRLPPNLTSGKVQVDLEVTDEGKGTGVTQVHTQSSFIIPDPPFEVQIDEDWDTKFVEFTWDVEYFKQHYPPGAPIFLEATIHMSDYGTTTFIQTGVRLPIGFNDVGTIRLQISDPAMAEISSFRYPYFYVLRPVGTQSDLYLTSQIRTPTLGITEEVAKELCSNWLLDARGPPHPDEVTPCPNCHCKAKLDSNFIKVDYVPQILELAEGQLDNHELFYQRVPSPSGHAQSCSYNVPTNALATSSPAVAAWMNFVSRDISYTENYLSDIWPYIVCCMQTKSAQHCQSFHERRPIDTGHNYPGPDDPCQGTGDPHMITFDGVRYDFMGYGEFWLVHGPGSEDGTFGVQGRMAPLTEDALVTYFKAIAVRDGDTTVQIQNDGQGVMQVIVNGADLLTFPTTPTTIPLGGITLSIDGAKMEVRLRTGFTIKVDPYSNNRVFNVYGSGAIAKKGKGYMGIFGHFDGDPENDLTNRAGTVIPPTDENIRNLSLLHNVFGLSWMTTPEESFFTYEEGLSWESFSNPDFGPILEYPDPATMPEEVRAICKENLACYYEYVGTGDLKDAEDTAAADDEFEELKEELDEEILLCPQVGFPPNGRVDVEGYLNGSVAKYSCGEEYELAGEANRMCVEAEGAADWAGEEPICNWTCGLCTGDIDYQVTHDPSDCTKFFLCTGGVRHFLVCPPDETFNREFLLCEKNYECSDPPGC